MSARVRPLVIAAAITAVAGASAPRGPLAAQQAAAQQAGAGQVTAGTPVEPRVPFGLTLGTSGGNRDTLGLLVVAVVPQSPADRAGVAEGSRIASINGVRLRLTPSEVGQPGTGDALVRRFDAELQNTRPGEPVVLEVVGGGRRQTVSVPLGGPAAATVLSNTSLAAGAPTSPTPALPTVAQAAPESTIGAAAGPPAAPTSGVVAPAAVGATVSAPGVAPAATVPTVSVPTAAAPAAVIDSAHAATLSALIDRMGELQQQLHRLARDQRSLAVADSLSDAEEDLATIRHRLRSTAARQAREDSTHDVGLPGLRLAAVNEDLAAYFGEGSARGLLVVQADASWDPIRTGDVVLRVDGAPADAERLRAAFQPQRRSTIEILRRRRVLTVALRGRAGA
ncbi:hypothetical protein tb265_24000 [Gemmatimonadetes bacterium T265]|nr:hypothetical protein tb265_24000 [Gemmatimonadetes bacterium T265]